PAQELHELDDLDVELGPRRVGSGGKRLHRRLHAFDVAAVIGAPNVDQGVKSAIDLGLVIGNVGGEVRVAAVRFHQRPVDVVAEFGRTKQDRKSTRLNSSHVSIS